MRRVNEHIVKFPILSGPAWDVQAKHSNCERMPVTSETYRLDDDDNDACLKKQYSSVYFFVSVREKGDNRPVSRKSSAVRQRLYMGAAAYRTNTPRQPKEKVFTYHCTKIV